MGWRFRKRIKVLPGVHINLGKKGVSLSVGPRGLKKTFGKDGVRTTVGLPGSGISHTSYQRYSSSSETSLNPMSAKSKTGPSRSAWFFLVFAGGGLLLWLFSLAGGSSTAQPPKPPQTSKAAAAPAIAPTPALASENTNAVAPRPAAAVKGPESSAALGPSDTVKEPKPPSDTYVPKQVRLKKPVKFNLYNNKVQVGSATIDIGGSVNVARILGEKVEVEYYGTKYLLPAAETDLLEQMLGTAEP